MKSTEADFGCQALFATPLPQITTPLPISIEYELMIEPAQGRKIDEHVGSEARIVLYGRAINEDRNGWR